MAMKITLFFNQANHGWTETWYNGDFETPVSLTTGLKNLFKLAVAFRAPLTTLEWVRFSIVGSPGKTRSFRLSGVVSSAEASDVRPDIVSTDVIFRIYGQNYGKRNIYIRGVPDAGVQRSTLGVPILGAELLAGIDAYLNRVASLNWGMLQTLTPTFGGPAYQYVTAIQADANFVGLTNVTYKNAIAGLAVGDYLIFRGNWDKKLIPGFPARARVVGLSVVGGNQVASIAYNMPGAAAVTPSQMRLTIGDTQLVAIVSWDFQAFSERKTGRPFGSLRGRRSAAFSRT